MGLDKANQWDQTSPTSNGFPQWTNAGRAEGEEELHMLNSDISLLANFEDTGSDGQPWIDEETGVITCRLEEFELRNEETCTREDSFAKTLEYAQNNTLWLQDFAAVWTKLVTHNQPELLRVDATDFVDTRDSVQIPSEPPILITQEPATLVTPAPATARLSTASDSPTAFVSSFCCFSKRTRNRESRCWRAMTEKDCNAVSPAGRRCEWNTNQCRELLYE